MPAMRPGATSSDKPVNTPTRPINATSAPNGHVTSGDLPEHGSVRSSPLYQALVLEKHLLGHRCCCFDMLEAGSTCSLKVSTQHRCENAPHLRHTLTGTSRLCQREIAQPGNPVAEGIDNVS